MTKLMSLQNKAFLSSYPPSLVSLKPTQILKIWNVVTSPLKSIYFIRLYLILHGHSTADDLRDRPAQEWEVMTFSPAPSQLPWLLFPSLPVCQNDLHREQWCMTSYCSCTALKLLKKIDFWVAVRLTLTASMHTSRKIVHRPSFFWDGSRWWSTGDRGFIEVVNFVLWILPSEWCKRSMIRGICALRTRLDSQHVCRRSRLFVFTNRAFFMFTWIFKHWSISKSWGGHVSFLGAVKKKADPTRSEAS